MKSQMFIIVGKSGSGKGTQAELLAQSLRSRGQDVYCLEMGDSFRDFLRESNYTASKSLEIAQQGDLQPDFLANYFFTEELIKYFNGTRDFILDGTPRTVQQARVLDGALRFYAVAHPIVIHLDIDDATVIARMQDRGRSDDQIASIHNRLQWFSTDTVAAIDFFAQQDDYYNVITVDATQDIDAIHADIMAQLSM